MSNLKDIAEYVAATQGFTKKGAEVALKCAFEFIKDELANGNDVVIDKFGKFEAGYRAARVGRNPLTGASLVVEAKNVVKFKPAKALKDEINQ